MIPVLFTQSSARILWLWIRATKELGLELKEAQGWTVQLFVLSLTVSSTQAVGWLLWDGGRGGQCSDPPHILHQTGKVMGEGPSGCGGETELLILLLLWGMLASCLLHLWTRGWGGVHRDAFMVFTVQPRWLILSLPSPPCVVSATTRGPQHFATLWRDRFLRRTWIFSCRNSEWLIFVSLSWSYSCGESAMLWASLFFLQLLYDVLALKLPPYFST